MANELRAHASWTRSVFPGHGLPVQTSSAGFTDLEKGLVGVSMQYKLHWAVMAVAQLFVTIGSLVSIPITVNYICECFRTHTTEATLVLNSMRLLLGLSINFYIQDWIQSVGIGWVYGMMAMFTVFAFFCLVVVIVYGHKIRELSPFHTSISEEGQTVLPSNGE